MKKTMAVMLVISLVSICILCAAEDLSAMSIDELTVRRQELIDELTQVNSLRGSMIRQQVEEGVVPEVALGKIVDLFPDEEFAKIVRDECGKFSIEQPVTQADLDRVKYPSLYSAEIHDLTGIGLLRNLKSIDVGSHYDGPFPADLRNCKSLEYLSMVFNPNIIEIPDWIGELSMLHTLILHDNGITSLPDSICDLMNLEYLYVGSNKSLAALPSNIGNLVNLKELSIQNTAISSLPDSIWNLQLSKLDMSGISIR